MSPNPKLKLDLIGGPLTIAVISPDPTIAAQLRSAVRVRRDIVVNDGTRGADVVIWDTGADGGNTPVALSGTATLALVNDASSARKAIIAGARGAIPRTVEPSGLIAAIIATKYGLSVRATELEGDDEPELGLQTAITERERDVLELLASGAGNRAIAQELGISEHTVKFHIASLLDKLSARTRTEAVVSALRGGLINL
ncbi:MAG: response regulator transcription factor [Deltaproteobacteria bacterium]|nr:response regulator transcription factor [Deltaproteobacteria bacterium]